MSSVGGLIQIELPSLMPLDCIFSTSYYSMLVLKCTWPLVFYVILGFAAKAQRKRGKDESADSLINFAFLIMFVVYPSISSSLLSMFCASWPPHSPILCPHLSCGVRHVA